MKKVRNEELCKRWAAESFMEHVFDDESEFVQINPQGKVEISVANLVKLVGYVLSASAAAI